MTISERLISLRQQNSKSQQEIADLLGIHKSLYCNYERSNRVPDLEKLKVLANFYNVPLRSLIILPLKNTVIYSDGLLDELQEAIDKHGIIGSTSEETRRHYNELKPILDKVINERNEALDFPDLDIAISEHVGAIVKVVTLEMRGEMLIDHALKDQMKQLEHLTGFHSDITP